MLFYQRSLNFSRIPFLTVIAVFAMLLSCSISGSIGYAQEKKKPVVKKIGATRYRLNEIEFDSKTREIFVSVVVNQKEGGPMEYFLVHENGKVHESILTTKASPLSLQIVLKLLKYQSGKGDIFNSFLRENAKATEGGDKKGRGDTVSIEIRWPKDEAPTAPANELVLDGRTSKAMEEGSWIYTGSLINEGSYMAEIEGALIAIYLDAIAMFNMSNEGADDDERWGANSEQIPEIGTHGTLVISLLEGESE